METNVLKRNYVMYAQSWSEENLARKSELAEKCLMPDFTYTDPNIRTAGHNHLFEYQSEVQRQVAGVKFVVKDFKTHHGRSLASWEMVDGADNVLLNGTSFVMHSADGRLTEVSGFFDSPVQATA